MIIDEASQMLPEKAIAAIARGNNLVVVGDNKQMPPTNWLKSSIEFEEEEEEVDAESILDLAQNRVGNTVSLKWHYRSRHPDLIRFSNRKFYDDRLEVFPTPGGSNSKLGHSPLLCSHLKNYLVFLNCFDQLCSLFDG